MMMKVAVPQRFKLRVVPDVKTLIFGSGREVHYIGGTEVLPPPLEGMRESEMINRLGTEYAEDAKKVLIEHNLRLVVYIAKKFDNTGVGVEDLISIGTIGLIKAINTFNPTKKIKLATYASRCIENEILMYLRRNSKTKMEVSIDEPLNVDWDGNELLLSDILGTEEDTIYKDLENEELEDIRIHSVAVAFQLTYFETRYDAESEEGLDLEPEETQAPSGLANADVSNLQRSDLETAAEAALGE